jgi:aminoglycoside 6'-N-acetyltransferase
VTSSRATSTSLGDGEVTLRPPRPEDLARLVEIWATPDVRRWWPGEDEESIRAMITGEEREVVPFVIEVAGRTRGFLQVYEEPDPMYRHAGLDLVLDPEVRGRGLGPRAIVLAARWAFARGHHRLVIDPNGANLAAQRAYEKVGFSRVGVMRRYEWSEAEGDWTDGILYELLVGELVVPGN